MENQMISSVSSYNLLTPALASVLLYYNLPAANRLFLLFLQGDVCETSLHTSPHSIIFLFLKKKERKEKQLHRDCGISLVRRGNVKNSLCLPKASRLLQMIAVLQCLTSTRNAIAPVYWSCPQGEISCRHSWSHFVGYNAGSVWTIHTPTLIKQDLHVGAWR